MGVMKSISLDIEETLEYIDKKLSNESNEYKTYFCLCLRRELSSRIRYGDKSEKEE